jgi:hypothetical protein
VAKRERVDSERDVERELDERNVDSINDIRRAHGSRRRHIADVGESAHLGLNADASPDRLEMNYAVLETVLPELIRQQARVEGMISAAAELVEDVNDGHGPIAHAMKKAFKQRANQAEGVLRALTRYNAELNLLIEGLRRSKTLYDRIDTEAAQQLNARGGVDG